MQKESDLSGSDGEEGSPKLNAEVLLINRLGASGYLSRGMFLIGNKKQRDMS